MQPAMPDALAEGRFQLLEVIGEGGMATVYRAFDQRLQRPRAIKVLAPALALRPALRKRFLAEAQTMANLEESRVVRIFDMGEDGDRVFIVMELVDGGSLLDRIRDFGPLPPRMAADATIQICESLQVAHDAGVIHRDIKPHNILLTRAGEIRVTDFGIAQVQTDDGDGMTRTGAVMGTWGFMAPEQKSNAKQVDGRADIYSVGATLWSLLRGETPPELFMADAEPDMLDGIPDELAEVIKRATRYRREERYVTARAMADSLRAFVPMLPDDPELTVPLVPPVLERRPTRTDTMQQLASEMIGGVQETMVPSVGEEPEPSPPIQIAAPAPAPRRPVDAPSFAEEPPRKAPWFFLFAVAVPGVALLGVVLVGAFVFWPGDPAGGPAKPVVAMGAPTDPAVGGPAAPAPIAGLPSAPVGSAATSVPTTTPAVPLAAPVSTNKTPAGDHHTATSPVQPTNPAPVAAVAPPVVPDVAAPPAAVTPPPVAEDQAPSLTITPPGDAHVGDTVTFRAAIAGGWSVKLYYRPASGGAFQEKVMQGSGGTFTTSLKAADTMLGGIDYFVKATRDDANIREGSPTAPKRVMVLPAG
jgi:serine/threonine-protein kinase